jgi:hypothetical protein
VVLVVAHQLMVVSTETEPRFPQDLEHLVRVTLAAKVTTDPLGTQVVAAEVQGKQGLTTTSQTIPLETTMFQTAQATEQIFTHQHHHMPHFQQPKKVEMV